MPEATAGSVRRTDQLGGGRSDPHADELDVQGNHRLEGRPLTHSGPMPAPATKKQRKAEWLEWLECWWDRRESHPTEEAGQRFMEQGRSGVG
jgi:hypothetical protein